MKTTLPLLLLLAAAAPAPAQDDCRYEAERSANVNASGANLIRVAAGSGTLRVEGKPGLGEVRIRGVACASDRDLLEAIALEADRSGGEVRVETVLPDRLGMNEYARLHLTIEVPEGLAADLRDGSGPIEVFNVGPLEIGDGSGEVVVEDVAGPVRIDDGSGEIRLADIRGDVEIDDNSGGIELRGIQGSVTLTDGSGEIRVENVTGSVLVRRDGSGGIRVADVRGDFVVERDGTGGVRHRNVGGQVRIASR